MPGLSAAAEITFSLAGMEAKALGSSSIDVEHLFLGLCKVADFVYVDLRDFPLQDPTSLDGARAEMQEYASFLADREFDVKKFRRTLRRILLESRTEVEEFTGHRSERCREVFSEAGSAASIRNDVIRLRDLLGAAIATPSVSLDRLFTELSYGRALLYPYEKEPAVREQGEGKRETASVDGPATPLLDQLGRNITRLAREGRLDPVIGRKEEIRRIGQILTQRKKNTPILVGDAGVGKTCIVEGFAIKAAHPQAPRAIRNMRIIELSFGSLVGGTKLRGDLEERLSNIIREASSDPNVVLFFDEIHSIVGGGSRDAAEIAVILKPALARGDIKLIGATTVDEYRRYVEKDPAMERRFQVIWVEEPTREEACEILKGLRGGFEQHHNVRIPDPLIQSVVDLTIRFLPDLRLPDKAIDVLDQTCAKKALRTLSPQDFSDEAAPAEIDLEDLAEVVADRSRIPLKNILASAGNEFADLHAKLSGRVFGQEHAIHEVVHTLQMARAGLKDPRKPLAVFLFAGASGSGKTELAKALAEALFQDERRLIAVDMSEYQEKHAVAKLLGAPPGFVGFGEEAVLIKKVRTNPHSVVLFDEIEKAHHDIFDVFLQIFDEGRLTDTHGRTIRFSETILILTTNLGSVGQEQEKRQIGFDASTGSKSRVPGKEYESRIEQELSQTFRPEFLNRIQKTIYFSPLDSKAMEQILQNYVDQLNRQLVSKELQVGLEEEAKDFLLQQGHNEKYGAREMKRTFDRYVTEPLSALLALGKFRNRGTIRVHVREDALQFEFPENRH